MDAWTNREILSEMGERLRRERLNRNMTMEEAAESSGLSLSTISKIENGGGFSVNSLLSLLRALDLLGRVDALLPEPTLSPIELAKLRGTTRQRATGRRGGQDDEDTWEW